MGSVLWTCPANWPVNCSVGSSAHRGLPVQGSTAVTPVLRNSPAFRVTTASPREAAAGSMSRTVRFVLVAVPPVWRRAADLPDRRDCKLCYQPAQVKAHCARGAIGHNRLVLGRSNPSGWQTIMEGDSRSETSLPARLRHHFHRGHSRRTAPIRHHRISGRCTTSRNCFLVIASAAFDSGYCPLSSVSAIQVSTGAHMVFRISCGRAQRDQKTGLAVPHSRYLRLWFLLARGAFSLPG